MYYFGVNWFCGPLLIFFFVLALCQISWEIFIFTGKRLEIKLQEIFTRSISLLSVEPIFHYFDERVLLLINVKSIFKKLQILSKIGVLSLMKVLNFNFCFYPIPLLDSQQCSAYLWLWLLKFNFYSINAAII